MLSAVLLPLTLVTGYYGMNVPLPFQSHWWANLIVLGLMGSIGAGLAWYFHRKRWL